MAVNKVVLGAVSIIDISDSTIKQDNVLKDMKGYGKDGEEVIGAIETFNGSYECSGDSTGGGTGGGVNVELYDITWETTNGVELTFEYMGVDENNTLVSMASTGTSGSLRCCEGIHSAWTHEEYNEMFGEWVYPSIESITDSEGNIREAYYINPNDMIGFRVGSSGHYKFNCY